MSTTVTSSAQLTTDVPTTAPFVAWPSGTTSGDIRIGATDPATGAGLGAGVIAFSDGSYNPNSKIWSFTASGPDPITLVEGLTVGVEASTGGILLRVVECPGLVQVAATMHGENTAIPLIEDGGGAPSGRRH